MLLGPKDGVSGHRASEVRRVANAHLDAYPPGDLDVLMASVSPKGGVWAGLAPPDGAVVLRDVGEIEALYGKMLGSIDNLGGDEITTVATDWFVFCEAVSRMRPKGVDQVISLVSVCIFGHDDTGRTSADLAWTFEPGQGAARPGRPDPGERLRSEAADVDAHLRRRQALVDGDAAAAVAGVAPASEFFVPCFDPDDERLEVNVSGRDAYREHVEAFLDRFEVKSSRPASITAGDSYVFSEFELDVVDRRRGQELVIRSALVEILDAEGDVVGVLHYAIEG